MIRAQFMVSLANTPLSRLFEHPLYDRNIWSTILTFAPLDASLSRFDLSRGMEPPQRGDKRPDRPDLSLLHPRNFQPLSLFPRVESSEFYTLLTIQRGKSLRDTAFLIAFASSPYFSKTESCAKKLFTAALDLHSALLFRAAIHQGHLYTVSPDFLGSLLVSAAQKGQIEAVRAFALSGCFNLLPSNYTFPSELNFLTFEAYCSGICNAGQRGWLGKALWAAATQGEQEIVRLLLVHLKAAQRPHRLFYSFSLVAASKIGRLRVVEELLKFESSFARVPHFFRNTSLQDMRLSFALCAAAQNDHFGIVGVLLSYIDAHPEAISPGLHPTVDALKTAVLHHSWTSVHLLLHCPRFKEISSSQVSFLTNDFMVQKVPFFLFRKFLTNLLDLERVEEIEGFLLRRKILQLAETHGSFLLAERLKAAWMKLCCTIL